MIAFIKKKYKGLKTSLRYEVINGAFRRYPDGREVCLDTPKGEAEYQRRIHAMAQRQNYRCGRDDHRIVVPTFDHSDLRGMGGSRRNDAIVDLNGQPINRASCWLCNGKAGSTRISSGQ